jgi:hypothetical protein
MKLSFIIIYSILTRNIIMSTPEEIHAIILTYPRKFYRGNNNLPYAGKRIIKMLHRLKIYKYGRFEYEIKMTPWIYDPFSSCFPYRCHANAARIVKENDLPKKFEHHIARVIAAAYLNHHKYSSDLRRCMPRLTFEDEMATIFKRKKIQLILPQPIFEEIAPHI